MVELRVHCGKNVITKKTQCYERYEVHEGHPDKLQFVGFLDWKDDSEVSFFVVVDPMRKERILKEIDRLQERDEPITGTDLYVPPVTATTPEEEIYNEFNESDFS